MSIEGKGTKEKGRERGRGVNETGKYERFYTTFFVIIILP